MKRRRKTEMALGFWSVQRSGGIPFELKDRWIPEGHQVEMSGNHLDM